MYLYDFYLPDNILYDVKQFHTYFIKSNNNTSFSHTIVVLLQYTLGDTKLLSLDDVQLIESYFDRREHRLNDFLRWMLMTGNFNHSTRNQTL